MTIKKPFNQKEPNMTLPAHPMQPTYLDKNGVLRFRRNAVVEMMRKVLRGCNYSLNEIARDVNNPENGITEDDWNQFQQLIGYSVSAAPIPWEMKDAAEKAHAEGVSFSVALHENASEELKALRNEMRDAVSRLYGIHPDDLPEYGPR